MSKIDLGTAAKPCACGGTYPKDIQLSQYNDVQYMIEHPGAFKAEGYRVECFSCLSHLGETELFSNPEDALAHWNNTFRFNGVTPT